MTESWDRINEALGAEALGRSLAPHVSRRTLFGIKSDVEATMERIAAEAAGGGADADDANRAARAELDRLARGLGPRLVLGRADRYYIYRARSAGYDIPAYPFSRSGELVEFLSDESAADVSDWYAALGVTPSQYRNLAAYALVALRGEDGVWAQRLVGGMGMYVDASRFVPLEKAAYLDSAPASVIARALAAVRSLLLNTMTKDVC